MMHYNDKDKLDTNKDLQNFKYFNTCNIIEKWNFLPKYVKYGLININDQVTSSLNHVFEFS